MTKLALVFLLLFISNMPSFAQAVKTKKIKSWTEICYEGKKKKDGTYQKTIPYSYSYFFDSYIYGALNDNVNTISLRNHLDFILGYERGTSARTVTFNEDGQWVSIENYDIIPGTSSITSNWQFKENIIQSEQSTEYGSYSTKWIYNKNGFLEETITSDKNKIVSKTKYNYLPEEQKIILNNYTPKDSLISNSTFSCDSNWNITELRVFTLEGYMTGLWSYNDNIKTEYLLKSEQGKIDRQQNWVMDKNVLRTYIDTHSPNDEKRKAESQYNFTYDEKGSILLIQTTYSNTNKSHSIEFKINYDAFGNWNSKTILDIGKNWNNEEEVKIYIQNRKIKYF